ncbi:MFS transporter [Arthrobacter pigmenti]
MGNFMVFYELFIYGYLALYIGQVFFPGTDAVAAFLAGFAVYAVTYAIRPLGALVLGRLADRRGRRPVLIGTMIVICIATALVGLLPTYDQVGLLAPVLLVVLRLIQGFAAAGEFGGAVTLMSEFAPKNRRGLYASWQSFTIGMAIITASAFATVLTGLLSEAQMLAWGWRIPFLAAVVFGVAALYLRTKIDESPVFEELQKLRAAQATAGETTRDRPDFQPLRFKIPTWALVPFIALALLAWQSGGSVFLQVLPAYADATMSVSGFTAQMLTLVAAVAFTLVIPIAGWCSDVFGRGKVMMTGAAIIGLIAYPMFLVIDEASLTLAYACVAVAGGAVGMLAGPGPAFLAELFHSDVRSTGVGVGFNVAEAIFGGAAGLIIGGLQSLTGDAVAAAYYPIIGAISSLIFLSLLRDTRRMDFHKEVVERGE